MPSCIFVKLFFKVQQLKNHRLKSGGMTFLTCEPCCALRDLGLYHGRGGCSGSDPAFDEVLNSRQARNSVDFDLPFPG